MRIFSLLLPAVFAAGVACSTPPNHGRRLASDAENVIGNGDAVVLTEKKIRIKTETLSRNLEGYAAGYDAASDLRMDFDIVCQGVLKEELSRFALKAYYPANLEEKSDCEDDNSFERSFSSFGRRLNENEIELDVPEIRLPSSQYGLRISLTDQRLVSGAFAKLIFIGKSIEDVRDNVNSVAWDRAEVNLLASVPIHFELESGSSSASWFARMNSESEASSDQVSLLLRSRGAPFRYEAPLSVDLSKGTRYDNQGRRIPAFFSNPETGLIPVLTFGGLKAKRDFRLYYYSKGSPAVQFRSFTSLPSGFYPIAASRGVAEWIEGDMPHLNLRVDDCLYAGATGCYRNKLCASANLDSLQVLGFEPEISDTVNFCSLSEKDIPAPVLRVIADIGSVHGRVAALFSKPFSDLFERGVGVILERSAVGEIGSFVQTRYRRITMQVHRNWIRTDGRINLATYAHEFGHLLSLDKPNRYSPKPLVKPWARGIQSLARNPLITETLADTFSLAVAGNGPEPDEQDYRCEDAYRQITPEQNYSFPRGYFDIYFGMRKIEACCKSATQKRPNTEYSRYTCKYLHAAWGENTPSKVPFDKVVLDPKDLANPPPIDPHQIGIPLNSFLYGLSQEFPAVRVHALYLNAMASFDPAQGQEQWICNFKTQPLPEPILLSRPSAKRFLAILKGVLKQGGLPEKAIENRWSEAHLEKVFPIASYYDQRTAIESKVQVIAKAAKKAGHPCHLENLITTNPDCVMECTETGSVGH